MAVNLSPIGGVAGQFFDNNGDPLTGGKIYTYAAGTTTPSPTYTTSGGTTPHPNPIILDAAGRVPSGEIWLTDGAQYKFVIKTSTDVQIGSYDNIIGINSNFVNYTNSQEIQTATAGQTVFTLTTMQYQPGTNSLSVFVDGVNQYGPGSSYAYTETSSTVVTFSSGLHVGAQVKFVTSAINASSYGDAEQISYNPPFTGGAATNVEAKLAQTVSVKDFGAVGDGIVDDTAAFQAALLAVNELYVPAGTWLVSQIVVAANKTIQTAGKATIIKQKSGQPSATPIIQVTGSNVQIGSFKATGNISTDPDEFNHVVNIRGNATNGAISNVLLGDIEGVNIRGDVLIVSAYTGYPVKNVQVGNVSGNNVYRNVVSITGCDGVSIASVTGTDIGYAHLVIEGETYTTPSVNIQIGQVSGSNVIVSGTTAAVYADAVNLGTLYLDAAAAGESTPPYPVATTHAFQIRNCKNLIVSYFKANGYDGQAVKQIYNAGDLTSQAINITSAEITDCCKTEATYLTNILGAGGITLLNIGSLKGAVTRSGASMIRGASNTIVGQTEIALSAGTLLSLACDDAQFDYLEVTGAAGVLTQSSSRVRFGGGNISSASLVSFSNACVFENLVATTSGSAVVGGASYEDHWLFNTTVNGSFYGSGPYSRVYTQAIRFGANWLWVDASGRLRIKSTTAPTSDTDGTVVGTQT